MIVIIKNEVNIQSEKICPIIILSSLTTHKLFKQNKIYDA